MRRQTKISGASEVQILRLALDLAAHPRDVIRSRITAADIFARGCLTGEEFEELEEYAEAIWDLAILENPLQTPRPFGKRTAEGQQAYNRFLLLLEHAKSHEAAISIAREASRKMPYNFVNQMGLDDAAERTINQRFDPAHALRFGRETPPLAQIRGKQPVKTKDLTMRQKNHRVGADFRIVPLGAPGPFMDKLKDPNTSPEWLKETFDGMGAVMLPSSTEPVMMAIAGNPNTPLSVLFSIAEARDPVICRVVAENPVWPLAVLENPNLLQETAKTVGGKKALGHLLVYPDFEAMAGGIAGQYTLHSSVYSAIRYGNGLYAVKNNRTGQVFAVRQWIDDLAESIRNQLDIVVDTQIMKAALSGGVGVMKTTKHTVGRSASVSHIQRAIDTAYAYWTGSVGAAPKKKVLTRSERMKRKAYLDSITQIQEKKRSPATTITGLGILRHWQKDKELIQLVQDMLGQTPGYYNIIQCVESSTPDEIDYWKHWYWKAHDDVERLARKHKVPFDVTCAVVAVLSPGNNWQLNMAAADYIMTHRKAEGSSAYGQNAAKALYMLSAWSTDQVRGPKVTVFYESLRRPFYTEDKVVLDGHMINLWRGDKRRIQNTKQPTIAERDQMLSDFDAAANDTGLPAQSLQALTWYVWRYSTDKPKPPLSEIRATQEAFKVELRKQKEGSRQRERLREEDESFWGHDRTEGVGAVSNPDLGIRSRKEVTQWLFYLSTEDLRRFAADIAEAILPMTKIQEEPLRAAEQSIQAARDYANGDITQKEMISFARQSAPLCFAQDFGSPSTIPQPHPQKERVTKADRACEAATFAAAIKQNATDHESASHAVAGALASSWGVGGTTSEYHRMLAGIITKYAMDSFAHADLIAKESYYPEFQGEDSVVVEATLLREFIRERMTWILSHKSATEADRDKASAILASMAEVSDPQQWLRLLNETAFRLFMTQCDPASYKSLSKFLVMIPKPRREEIGRATANGRLALGARSRAKKATKKAPAKAKKQSTKALSPRERMLQLASDPNRMGPQDIREYLEDEYAGFQIEATRRLLQNDSYPLWILEDPTLMEYLHGILPGPHDCEDVYKSLECDLDNAEYDLSGISDVKEAKGDAMLLDAVEMHKGRLLDGVAASRMLGGQCASFCHTLSRKICQWMISIGMFRNDKEIEKEVLATQKMKGFLDGYIAMVRESNPHA